MENGEFTEGEEIYAMYVYGIVDVPFVTWLPIETGNARRGAVQCCVLLLFGIYRRGVVGGIELYSDEGPNSQL